MAAVFALFLGGAVACGESVGVDGRTVGGACRDSTECADQSRCVTGGDFPGGMCTRNCANHDDCPAGARCVDKDDGICLLACETPADCRGGYTCKARKNELEGGESLVCIE